MSGCCHRVLIERLGFRCNPYSATTSQMTLVRRGNWLLEPVSTTQTDVVKEKPYDHHQRQHSEKHISQVLLSSSSFCHLSLSSRNRRNNRSCSHVHLEGCLVSANLELRILLNLTQQKCGEEMTRKPIQQPNRLTRIFSRMKETCPQHIKAYATCVIRHQQEGTLDKGSCQAEFSMVKDCFRSVRRR